MWLGRLARRLFRLSVSTVRRDEEVLFFPTGGWMTPDASHWNIAVQGWIYERKPNSVPRRHLMGLLRHALNVDTKDLESALFQERAWPFLVDNERGKRLRIQIGENVHTLAPSAPSGHFQGIVPLSVDEAERIAPEGWLRYQVVMSPDDDRQFAGQAQLIGPRGLTVISDIDDTIKISEVTDRRALLKNTFLREFRAVPGMADLYRKLANDGAVFHYVSSSPWQLFTPLSTFLRIEGFPAGSFHLRLFRWKDARHRGLAPNHEVTKRAAILPMLELFPQRRFVLVGDSGEKDPEIYGLLARERPDQVAQILIRNTTGEMATSERFRQVFRDLPDDLWQLFTDPADVMLHQ